MIYVFTRFRPNYYFSNSEIVVQRITSCKLATSSAPAKIRISTEVSQIIQQSKAYFMFVVWWNSSYTVSFRIFSYDIFVSMTSWIRPYIVKVENNILILFLWSPWGDQINFSFYLAARAIDECVFATKPFSNRVFDACFSWEGEWPIKLGSSSCVIVWLWTFKLSRVTQYIVAKSLVEKLFRNLALSFE